MYRTERRRFIIDCRNVEEDPTRRFSCTCCLNEHMCTSIYTLPTESMQHHNFSWNHPYGMKCDMSSEIKKPTRQVSQGKPITTESSINSVYFLDSSGKQLTCGGQYFPGETLYPQISTYSKNQYLLQVNADVFPNCNFLRWEKHSEHEHESINIHRSYHRDGYTRLAIENYLPANFAITSPTSGTLTLIGAAASAYGQVTYDTCKSKKGNITKGNYDTCKFDKGSNVLLEAWFIDL